MACSLFLGEFIINQAIYVELSGRVIALIDNRSFVFRSGFVAFVMLSKVLIVVRYRLTHRGEQLSSLQRQTKLPFCLLMIPTALKLGIYMAGWYLHSFTNTSLFGVIAFINLLLLEMRNHYLVY
jgi:hypothetical protein